MHGYIKSDNGNIIENCINNGIIEQGNQIGGIAGFLYGEATVRGCSNNARIETNMVLLTGDNYSHVGGIIGAAVGGNILECSNTANISGSSAVGGIIGDSYAFNTDTFFNIENCNNSGIITSKGYKATNYYANGKTEAYNVCYTGGIAGWGIRTKIKGSNNKIAGTVTTEGNTNIDIYAIGGIIGEIRYGEISNSYNEGTIGNSYKGDVAGIAGVGMYQVNINNCYNAGKINGKFPVGGIIGYASQAKIENCYNNATISAVQEGGGIVGEMKPFEQNSNTNNGIYYCYNIGKINGTSLCGGLGGFVKYFQMDCIYILEGVANDYWGQIQEYQVGSNYGILNKSNLIATIQSKFGNSFKADSYNKNNGYPILSWQ